MSENSENLIEPGPHAPTILIIEDELTNLAAIADYLQEHGFNIQVSRDGKHGIEVAQRSHPSLILLDVMMPGLNGFETCQRLKALEDLKDIPVIFMTALAETYEKVKGFQVGAVDYITKPIQNEELLARVTTHLEIRGLTRELQEANKTLSRRTTQLETSRQVSQHVASLLALDELLPEVPRLIRTQFGYYFVGIWLLNEQQDKIILEAADGGESNKPFEPGLAIPLDEGDSIIVSTYQTGQYHLCDNNGTVSSHRQKTEISDICFEVALPLRIGQKIIGVLGITNQPETSFNREEVGMMQTLANQIALAIRNAQLYYKLEIRVAERTVDLAAANKKLQLEIAERKQAEAASQESEKRLRQFITSISDHVYVTRITPDGHHTNLYISPNVEDLTGYSSAVFQENWRFWSSSVIHPKDTAIGTTQLMRLAEGQNSETEYRLVRADGEVIWVRDSAKVEHDNQSKTIYGVISNITERKRIEQEIREINVNLEQRVANRTRELFALYELAAIAGQSLDMTTTLEQLLPQVLMAVDSNIGAIHLYDNENQTLNLAVQQGLSAPGITEIETEAGLVRKAIEQGMPLILSDTTGDATANLLKFDADIKIYTGLPMRARGVIIGVLSVFWKATQYELELSVEEITLLTTIADLLGVVVESIRLRQLAEKAAVLEERGRLSRELHDSVTQSLYSLTLLAEWGSDLLKAGKSEPAKQRMIEISETAQQALKEMRLLVYQLRPKTLAKDGLVGALQQRLDAVERRTDAEILFQADPLIKLPASVEEELYRIALEALNNASKHAAAGLITIRLASEEGQLTLTVKDNGVGFIPAMASSKGGLGLVTMQERTDQIGGALAIVSAPGEGTTVKVTLEVPG